MSPSHIIRCGTRPERYIASGTAVMFGVDHKGGTLQGLATIPEFVWELFLGLYCTFKGFRRSSPILEANAGGDRAVATPA
jgi:hypothetical protein